ncbi:hypothetical protein HZS_6330, partial [Henneguya salminicola]
DAIAVRFWDVKDNTFFIVGASIDHAKHPPTKENVRMISYISGYQAIKKSDDKIYLYVLAHVHPCGHIPTWVVNMVAPRLYENFIKRFTAALTEYSNIVSGSERLQSSFQARLLKNPDIDWNDVGNSNINLTAESSDEFQDCIPQS